MKKIKAKERLAVLNLLHKEKILHFPCNEDWVIFRNRVTRGEMAGTVKVCKNLVVTIQDKHNHETECSNSSKPSLMVSIAGIEIETVEQLKELLCKK